MADFSYVSLENALKRLHAREQIGADLTLSKKRFCEMLLNASDPATH